MADGSRTKTYGQITLSVTLRTIQREINFQVARTHHDAILGIDFLQEGCLLDLGKAEMVIDGKHLACTDRHGLPLSSKVQVLKTTQIPAGTESSLKCRLTNAVSGHQGLVEGIRHPTLAVEACLVTTNTKSHMLPVRCYNPTSYPVTITAGSIIGNYIPVSDEQITHTTEGPNLNHTEFTDAPTPSPDIYTVPVPLQELYADACKTCSNPEECQDMAKLLNTHGDVFSSGADDVGLTDLVIHSIPVTPGTKPIKQPPRRLGVSRDQEVEPQVKQSAQTSAPLGGEEGERNSSTRSAASSRPHISDNATSSSTCMSNLSKPHLSANADLRTAIPPKPPDPVITTRSGRQVKPPSYLSNYST
jgi:hypothetical protein